MGEDFVVDTSYTGYVFVGWAEGQSKTEDGRMMPYTNMFYDDHTGIINTDQIAEDVELQHFVSPMLHTSPHNIPDMPRL